MFAGLKVASRGSAEASLTHFFVALHDRFSRCRNPVLLMQSSSWTYFVLKMYGTYSSIYVKGLLRRMAHLVAYQCPCYLLHCYWKNDSGSGFFRTVYRVDEITIRSQYRLEWTSYDKEKPWDGQSRARKGHLVVIPSSFQNWSSAIITADKGASVGQKSITGNTFLVPAADQWMLKCVKKKTPTFLLLRTRTLCGFWGICNSCAMLVSGYFQAHEIPRISVGSPCPFNHG